MRHTLAPGPPTQHRHARQLKAPASEATFGQESVSNSRLGVQFLLGLALRLRNPSRIRSPRARCPAQVRFRSCSCVSAYCLFFLCFLLVLLWQQCRPYKRLCPFCPQNPLKKLPGHFTTLKDLSKSVTNPGGCRPLDPVTLTQHSVPQPSSSSGNGCDRTEERLVPTQTEGTSGPF